MGSTWLKFKVYGKLIFGALLLIYFAMLILLNRSEQAEIWYLPFTARTSLPVLLLALLMFVCGIAVTLLATTFVRTMRQLRTLRQRKVADKLDREITLMQSKASRLQTRPGSGTGSDY